MSYNNFSPLVSVLMPAYNAGKFIKQAIESVLNQTYSNIELLIADDGSKDCTKKIIEAYTDPRIKTFYNTENIGYLQTTNKLFALAIGDFITFQDADDYSHTQRLELLLKEFENDIELGVCGSNYCRIDYKGNIVFASDFASSHDEIKIKMPEVFDFIGSGLMIKKEVYNIIGGYNIFFDRMGAEDNYWAWLIMERYKMKNIKNILYFYQYHKRSISGNLSDNYRKLLSREYVSFLIKQRLKYGSDGLNNDELAKEFSDYIAVKEKPFEEDRSHFFRRLSTREFYASRQKSALYYALKAIKIKPFKEENIGNLFYFLTNKPKI